MFKPVHRWRSKHSLFLKICTGLLVSGVIFVLGLFWFSSIVFALGDLNEIGRPPVEPIVQEEVQEPQEPQESAEPYNPIKDNSDKNAESARAVASLFKSAGVDQESTEQAVVWIAPVAKIINLCIAIILGLLSLALVLGTV